MGLPQRIAAIAFVCLLAAAYFIAWRSPATGTFHDDGIYTVTAKALAEGKGYRIISLPNEIPQTKYPILFPAALAAVWKVAPGFPANLPLLRLVPMLAAALWFWLSYKLFREEGESPQSAAAVVALAAASPWVVYFSTALLSESLFAALLSAWLICLRRLERGRTDTWLPYATAILAAASFHTRTAGIVLIIAAPLLLMVKRRRKDAILNAATAIALCLPWLLWVAANRVPNGGINDYYSSANYQGWNILANFTIPQKLDILLSNTLMSLASPAILMGFPIQTPPAVALVIGIGFAWAAFRLRANAITLMLALYTAMLLCWAFPPARFFAPVLPLLYYAAWKSAGRFRPAAFAVCTVLLIAGSNNTLRHGDALPTTTENESWRRTAQTIHWLRENTPPGAILAGNLDPMLYLYTGRKAVRGFNADPYELVYQPSQFPLGTPNNVIGGFRQFAVSHWVIAPCTPFAECKPLAHLADTVANSGEIEPLSTGLTPAVQIYKVAARR